MRALWVEALAPDYAGCVLKETPTPDPGPGEVLVEVRDEGLGLADTANLFVPFFTTKQQGSGIGLALSRLIAEAHRGQLTLENRGDRRGCLARLRLPR